MNQSTEVPEVPGTRSCPMPLNQHQQVLKNGYCFGSNRSSLVSLNMVHTTTAHYSTDQSRNLP